MLIWWPGDGILRDEGRGYPAGDENENAVLKADCSNYIIQRCHSKRGDAGEWV